MGLSDEDVCVLEYVKKIGYRDYCMGRKGSGCFDFFWK